MTKDHFLEAPVIDPARLCVGRLVGHGGFAQVFSATLKTSDSGRRAVAFKLLRPAKRGGPHVAKVMARLFLSEARACATLDHPNLVRCMGLLRVEPGFPGVPGLAEATWGMVLAYCEPRWRPWGLSNSGGGAAATTPLRSPPLMMLRPTPTHAAAVAAAAAAPYGGSTSVGPLVNADLVFLAGASTDSHKHVHTHASSGANAFARPGGGSVAAGGAGGGGSGGGEGRSRGTATVVVLEAVANEQAAWGGGDGAARSYTNSTTPTPTPTATATVTALTTANQSNNPDCLMDSMPSGAQYISESEAGPPSLASGGAASGAARTLAPNAPGPPARASAGTGAGAGARDGGAAGRSPDPQRPSLQPSGAQAPGGGSFYRGVLGAGAGAGAVAAPAAQPPGATLIDPASPRGATKPVLRSQHANSPLSRLQPPGAAAADTPARAQASVGDFGASLASQVRKLMRAPSRQAIASPHHPPPAKQDSIRSRPDSVNSISIGIMRESSFLSLFSTASNADDSPAATYHAHPSRLGGGAAAVPATAAAAAVAGRSRSRHAPVRNATTGHLGTSAGTAPSSAARTGASSSRAPSRAASAVGARYAALHPELQIQGARAPRPASRAHQSGSGEAEEEGGAAPAAGAVTLRAGGCSGPQAMAAREAALHAPSSRRGTVGTIRSSGGMTSRAGSPSTGPAHGPLRPASGSYVAARNAFGAEHRQSSGPLEAMRGGQRQSRTGGQSRTNMTLDVAPESLHQHMRSLKSITALLRDPSGKLPDLPGRDMDWVYGLTGQAGSCCYMAPEVFLRQPYNAKVDVFSMGVLMYELWSHKLLQTTYTQTAKGDALGVKSPADYARLVSGGFRPSRPPLHVSDAQWELVCRCWHSDPCERPDMVELAAELGAMLQRELEVGVADGHKRGEAEGHAR
ncbi:Dual specificity protein kinase shkB [Tetrabaena socialis]|uniref:Dual specificity protein kinase shkB n=1 Tax=Tetrabaena socialis TaxID=47790 RepID=A0A2J8AI84_9CHLO|nr:Dual specificity protein kinase shkB [Tetrabaena socialis]|eukprot:PNH12221.1 Dual specificity protein kinase shkB [Tetrabaena socialis]